MDFLGEHLLIELYGCDEELLDNSKKIEQIMLEAVEIAKATLVKSVFHDFSPQGVTGVVVVEESHFAIHTWPEHKYAAIDLFTCSEKMDYKAAYIFMRNKLSAEKYFYKKVLRGDKKLLSPNI